MNIQEIKELYLKGESLAELGRLYDCHPTTIKRYLLEEGVQLRTRVEQTRISNTKRKKAVQEDYFSTIDTVNKAWLLGFIAADGSIGKERNTIAIQLSSIDSEILYKIQKEISFEGTIKNELSSNGFAISKLIWTSQQHKQDLSKYGIVNNKTYLPMHLPDLKNDNLILSFILGFFDGDGSFSVKYPYCRIRFCAHRDELLKEIGEFLKTNYQASYSLSQDKRGLYELSISTIFAKQILKDMYSLNSLRLDRKYQKYLDYINQETETS